MSATGDPAETDQPLTRRELRELRTRELAASAAAPAPLTPASPGAALEPARGTPELAPAPLEPATPEAAVTRTPEPIPAPLIPATLAAAAARDAQAAPAVEEITPVADVLIAAELHDADLVPAALTESDRVVAAPVDDIAAAFDLLLAEVTTTTSTNIPLPSRAQLRAQEREARASQARRTEAAARQAAVPAAPAARRAAVPVAPNVPVLTPATQAVPTLAPALSPAAFVTPARPRAAGDRARSAAAKGLTVVAMAFVALMAVSTSLPAEALLSSADVQAAAFDARRSSTDAPAQTLARAAGTDTITVKRDGYQAQSIAEFAAASGIRMEATFTNNPNGTIQWPFAVGVHIGDRFGPRSCAGCSSNHGGQDFNPGDKAPIQAIADGVVSEARDGSGSLGTYMIVDHMINGELVSSVYAHMTRGSMLFKTGDVIKVAQILGKVGNTGMSTGPHLHLDIRIGGKNGTKVDPLEWLYANTN